MRRKEGSFLKAAAGIINVLSALAFNIPLMMIQRYNRIRLKTGSAKAICIKKTDVFPKKSISLL
ncbi:hypothetical protein AB1K32_10960 [Metabacillus dongyingensis]|uniref:glycosyl-4,4'-diaponeurosporenoate acyltransferase CrtO family protein n=1 Tax=Metabacillus dongyingensis TaxID=2874282 RepID=UPI003B8DBE91